VEGYLSGNCVIIGSDGKSNKQSNQRFKAKKMKQNTEMTTDVKTNSTIPRYYWLVQCLNREYFFTIKVASN